MRVVVLAVCVLALSAGALFLAPRSGEATATQAQRNQMLLLINEWRLQNGLSTLALHPSAIDVAENLALCNAGNNSLSFGCGGTHATRVTAQSCQWVTGNNNRLGENILLIPSGFPNTVQAAFDAWKSDPGSNDALLIPSATQLGVGQSDHAPTGNHYWAIDLVTNCTNGTNIPTPVPTPSPTPTPTPDADGDTVPDGSDNCPNWANPTQIPPVWFVPPEDPDCDGFPTSAETFAETNPTGHCASTTERLDEPGTDQWAADFDDNQLANLLDLIVYADSLNTADGNPDYTRRADLNGSGVINLLDLVAYATMLNTRCDGP